MEAILFDWDGTLVDSLGAFHRANAIVMESFGLAFDIQTYRRHYTPDWREMYLRLGIPSDRLDEANDRWETAFADGGDSVIAFPGAAAALHGLRAAGAVLGIVTAGHREVVEPQLERTGLGALLEVRVFGDDLPVHKPDPEPLRLALRMAGDGHRPDTSIYVGDAPTDMLMAVAVGARAVGIESAVGDPDDLRAAGAVELAPSVAAWAERHLARAASAASAARATLASRTKRATGGTGQPGRR
ncbi:MAG TPA: HAD hydrolase-like protein [Verrucomicrobiae bacterium]|jgi:phosphoglycolate phosphatase-like HAD superfamily hydrolase|nr:HAD hydrolase-like protein [Verrucomicrobiae bacterium]